MERTDGTHGWATRMQRCTPSPRNMPTSDTNSWSTRSDDPWLQFSLASILSAFDALWLRPALRSSVGTACASDVEKHRSRRGIRMGLHAARPRREGSRPFGRCGGTVRRRRHQGRALEPYCKVGSASIDPDLPLRAASAMEAWSSSRKSPIPRVQARFEAMCLEARPRGSRSVSISSVHLSFPSV
jgi:hypothetical protein